MAGFMYLAVLQGRFAPGGPRLNRSVATGAVAQRRGSGDAQPLPADFLRRSSGGRPLGDSVRTKMESFFKADFSDVRIHVGPEAGSIGALAFTMGSNIYLAPSQANLDSFQGQALLGHELTHVLQQRAGRVRNPFGSGIAVVQDHALEAEADRMGLRAASHRMPDSAPVQRKAASAAGGYRLLVGAYMHQGKQLPEQIAGHGFVAIEGPGGRRQSFGFSPASSDRDVGRLSAGVPGRVHDDAAAFRQPGVRMRSVPIDEGQARAAMAKVADYRARGSFNLANRQCTTFATEVARAAGVELSPAGQTLTPRALYRKL